MVSPPQHNSLLLEPYGFETISWKTRLTLNNVYTFYTSGTISAAAVDEKIETVNDYKLDVKLCISKVGLEP